MTIPLTNLVEADTTDLLNELLGAEAQEFEEFTNPSYNTRRSGRRCRWKGGQKRKRRERRSRDLASRLLHLPLALHLLCFSRESLQQVRDLPCPCSDS